MYTEDAQPSDQCLFICECKALHDRCIGLTETCSCLGYASWRLESFDSFKNMHMYFCIHVCVHVHVVYFYMCIYVLFMCMCHTIIRVLCFL